MRRKGNNGTYHIIFDDAEPAMHMRAATREHVGGQGGWQLRGRPRGEGAMVVRGECARRAARRKCWRVSCARIGRGAVWTAHPAFRRPIRQLSKPCLTRLGRRPREVAVCGPSAQVACGARGGWRPPFCTISVRIATMRQLAASAAGHAVQLDSRPGGNRPHLAQPAASVAAGSLPTEFTPA